MTDLPSGLAKGDSSESRVHISFQLELLCCVRRTFTSDNMPLSSSVSVISEDCLSLDFFAPRGDDAVLSTSLSNKLYKTNPTHFHSYPCPYLVPLNLKYLRRQSIRQSVRQSESKYN